MHTDVGSWRKKPVVIAALRWMDDEDEKALRAWVPGIRGRSQEGTPGYALVVPTLEGDMLAQRGDWIIRGVAGEFYPCKPDIFEATYESVEPGTDRNAQ